ncbi:hypothetical protein [Methylocystis bryophila]|uniref:DNA methyltransferase n=1 Tax=Methylocystis bryophila TaxID=655015 RepID=A0A1W6N074_9HYPH|nr:hypothetical protein [Methylocystis bryophila]ARN83199.1 hypothetical protein B1812_21335 [Methylocystis bryophila]BDV39539.1 hypothetical protein DSM21852_27920 [Methylocystis bryophila]
MSVLTDLAIQLIAGAIGGNAAGGLLKNIDLGPIAKTISGAVGGGIGGQLLQAVIPALAGAASAPGGFDIAAAAGQAVGGGVTGAIVTVIVGLIKNSLMKKAA